MKKALPLVAVVFLAACGGSATSGPDTTAGASGGSSVQPAPTNPAAGMPTNPAAGKIAGPVTIDVTVGTDSGPDRVENLPTGTDVTINIVNPSADDEFHLHGYDMSTGETAKGVTASISFTADKPGKFEVESHVTEEIILVVVVG